MAFELIKVSELPELTTPSDPNVLPIQDGDYLKRISFENLKEAATGGVADDLAAEVTAREGAVSGEATARGNADTAILADLASPYSASATYAVGDYCTKDGQLYRCTTAIETAEAWTAAHWSAVALGDDTSDLRSALSEETRNMFDGTISTFSDTELVNGEIKNTAADTRTEVIFVTRYRNNSTIISTPSMIITRDGKYSITSTPEEDGNNIIIGHSGYAKNLWIIVPFNVIADKTYTISFTIKGHDPKTIGGFIYSDIQIEEGNTATDYVPHITAVDAEARNETNNNKAAIVELQNIVPSFQVVQTETVNGKNWLRYTDGAIFATSSPIYVHTIKNDGYSQVKVESYAKDNASAAIAFYSTDTIDTSGYMASSSVQCKVGQNEYNALVPEGCKLIAFTHRTDYAEGVDGKFNVYLLAKELLPDIVEQVSKIPTLEEDLPYIFTENILPILPYKHHYIRYSDGASIGSGNYMFAYTLKNYGFRTVRANLYVTDTVPAVIAFYSTEEVSTDGYMKSASVQAKTGWGYYEAEVPDGCKLIAFTTRDDSSAEEAYVKVAGSDFSFATYNVANASTKASGVAENNANVGLISTLKPCYDHLFVNKSGNNIVIPHESLYHIRLSAKMGYKMIEANVAPTSDGVYIVNHLASGKFGSYFHHVDGETDISDIALNSVTWDWVEQNVRYNSTIPKYRTRPCRLEEFLAECRQQNILPFLGRANDANVVAIADKYMGVGNYVAYGGTRAISPYAVIYHWVSNLTDVDDILAYCENIGKPFIYGLGNINSFTDAQLKEVVDTLHQNGYMIGTSYADSRWAEYIGMGFDFNGTQSLMNRIESGNLHNINSIFGFDDFTFSNATETDGVLTFSDAGNIYPDIEDTTYDVCAIDVEIWFDGGIIFYAIGELTSNTGFTSDGTQAVFVTIPIINGSPKWHIVAQSGCKVYDIKFRASVI